MYSSVSDSLVRNYHRSFNGFAAKLTEEESRKIASMESVVSVFPSKTYELHTTRSWDFMSFTSAVKRMPEVESDIIVGVLDSGVWPESESFHDEGFGPPPKKWKGICQSAKNFSCNNKLIGGRSYDGEGSDISPRDIVGHGTHTSSIILGREVEGVSLFNLAKGTARGALPYARLAAYQVCSLGCSTVNILAGFDDAIADGVDIISVSLGGLSAFAFEEDVISIGGFHAMKKGILTSQSAGNSGPEPYTVQSVAPWLLSVAASNIDRWINNKISLGDGTTFVGNAINTFGSQEQEFPLIHGKQAESSCGPEDARYCRIGCLDENLVKGKIVFCATYSKGIGALVAGAVGTIMVDDIYNDCPFSYPLPATLLTRKTGGKVDNYINNTKNPKASILRSEDSLKSKAPVVVSFSSRGPTASHRTFSRHRKTSPA